MVAGVLPRMGDHRLPRRVRPRKLLEKAGQSGQGGVAEDIMVGLKYPWGSHYDAEIFAGLWPRGRGKRKKHPKTGREGDTVAKRGGQE